jgi:flagellar hook-basal body complex protein FliE
MRSPSKASTMVPPRYGGTASIPQAESNSAAKKRDRQIQEGWLKMICQEIEQKQTEAEECMSNGITNKRGIINEIILKFQTSLPYHIACILCFTWLKPFCRMVTNNTATCERGWGHLNQDFLDDYNIQNARDHIIKRG